MQGETLVDRGGRTSRIGPDGGAVLDSTRPVRLRFPERVTKRWAFSSPSHSSRLFKERFGVAPRELQRPRGGE